MKFNKWTVGLAAVGVVSLASAARADEKMSQLQTALSSTTLSGYIDTAATFSPGNAGAGYSYGGAAAQANGFTVNAIDLALDHPEDSSPWASGYHVELELGPDTPQAGTGAYPIRQAYMTLRTPVGNGIDWKVGYFDTIIGYESNSDPANPNYTRSYGYTIEPTSHTGILGTYVINSVITVSAGVADTTYAAGAAFDTGAYNPSLLGSVALTAPDSWGWVKGATFSFGAVNTPSQFAGGATSWYAGATLPTPIAALKFGASFDYLDEHNATAANSTGDGIWDVALYSTYQATDKLSLNARAEYLDGSDTGATSTTAVYGHNTAEEVTLTAQYNLWANVLSRAEIRWDHVSHGAGFASPGTPESNAYMLALNLIYQF
jgi:hypothetical protein